MNALQAACRGSSIRRTAAWRQLLVVRSLGVALLACLGASSAAAQWHGQAIDLMGTRVSVELWHENSTVGDALVEEVLDEYRRIDELMSTYRPDSEISLVNREGRDRDVPVSSELFALIERALEISRRSNGAFDISYESIGYLYDFRLRTRPSAEQIDRALSAIDYRGIVLDSSARAVRFDQSGMRINLGGIAKGHAIERGAQLLRSRGVEHALLNAGGDTRVIGDRRGKPWIVGIRHPRVAEEFVTRLPLIDEAISTSGDYERFFEEDGRRYHHIIDPQTGQSTEEMLSVTVLGPDAVLTDGLSTTLFVLGLEAGLELIDSYPGYEAIVVDRHGRLRFSAGLTDPGDSD